MRKHDVRKWLHAILDLLPVILIPVFMIYSHRHDVSQDFEVVTQEAVYYDTNEVDSANDFVVGNAYYFIDNAPSITPTGSNELLFAIYNNDTLKNLISNIDNFDYLNVAYNSEGTLSLRGYPQNSYIALLTNYRFPFLIYQNYGSSYTSNLVDCVTPYNSYFKEYQDVITTIPKDVMSSFMDRFNNTIDKYFNMGNVFNLGDVYQWFNTNIFGGNAPVVIYSIYNIVLYELVMDLLFLLYALFMWFIDMIQKLMEKPLNSIK